MYMYMYDVNENAMRPQRLASGGMSRDTPMQCCGNATARDILCGLDMAIAARQVHERVPLRIGDIDVSTYSHEHLGHLRSPDQ